jgi:hypothetical protein
MQGPNKYDDKHTSPCQKQGNAFSAMNQQTVLSYEHSTQNSRYAKNAGSISLLRKDHTSPGTDKQTDTQPHNGLNKRHTRSVYSTDT